MFTAATVLLLVGCKGNGSSSAIPQSLTNWIWESGSNAANSSGNYSVAQGSATATGQPSGRSNPMTWRDASGQFWVFSGAGGASDMWKFNTTTLQWAWMSGTSITASSTAGHYPASSGLTSGALANLPGQRSGGATWVDASGNLWMYGGYGTDSNGLIGYMNDLWFFNPTTNWWTWVSGSNQAGSLSAPCVWGGTTPPGTTAATNQPAPRSNAATWTDTTTGNFYMFGGQGYLSANSNCNGANNADVQNDLWEFNPVTLTWTWLGGTQGFNATGVYGKQNIASATNQPGSRQSATTWTDKNGIFWMFGGRGIDGAGGNGYLNDLWKFDPVAAQWTWVNGSATVNFVGAYGTNAVPAATNQPGSRYGGLGWVDTSGNLWLFGGYGINSTGTVVLLNDLWEYQVSVGQWVWVNGSYNGNASSYYGTINVLSTGNMPGSRYGASGWVDSAGNFWMYGGEGYDAIGTNGPLSDVWKFLP